MRLRTVIKTISFVISVRPSVRPSDRPATRHLSVLPYETTRLTLEGRLWRNSSSCTLRQQCQTAARSRFDPGNSVPWDVRVLFKTHITFFTKVRIGKQRPFWSLCKLLPWVLRLATVVAGVRLEEEGWGDHVTEWISAGQQSNLRLWCGAF